MCFRLLNVLRSYRLECELCGEYVRSDMSEI